MARRRSSNDLVNALTKKTHDRSTTNDEQVTKRRETNSPVEAKPQNYHQGSYPSTSLSPAH